MTALFLVAWWGMEAGGLGFIGQGLTTFTPGCTQLGVRTCVRSRPAVRRRSPGLEGLQCLQSERQSETDLFDFDINDFGGAEEGWSMEEDEGKENEKHDEKPKKVSEMAFRACFPVPIEVAFLDK